MGLISGLLQTAVDTVSLPISATQDIFGIGEDNTTKRIHKIGEDIEDTFDGDFI